MADKTITITLTRSLIGEKPKTRATVQSLGLRKINQTVTHRDDETIRGMVHKVRHLVALEGSGDPHRRLDLHRGSSSEWC